MMKFAEHRGRRNPIVWLLAFAACVAVAAGLAWLWGRRLPGEPAAGVMRLVLLGQCVADAAAAPLLAGRVRCPGRVLLGVLALVAAGSTAAIAAGLLLGGSVPAWVMLLWVARSAAILAGFGLLLTGLARLAERLAPQPAGLMAAIAAAALMLGTVFCANPAVAAARNGTKMALVQAAVAANPLLCVAGSALDYDILLSRRTPGSLYHMSLIGPDHIYRYPPWWAVAPGYAAAGGLLLALSRKRAAGNMDSGGSS